jgi:cyclopropane fatty-acyl-phospholipid synthase-like methyltransferase
MKYCSNEKSELTDFDKKIIDYIFANSDEDYSAVLEKDGDLEVFHQLAKTRESILNWYDFKENSNVLEIGSGYGAITGLLCDKCKSVTCVESKTYIAEALAKRCKNRTNLEVYAGNVLDMHFDIKFDYIVMLGVWNIRVMAVKGRPRILSLSEG